VITVLRDLALVVALILVVAVLEAVFGVVTSLRGAR
jgi:hypothetical protein